MAGTQSGTFFEIIATGDFQPVTLVTSVSKVVIACKMDNTIFSNLDAPLEFHLSFHADGTGSIPTTGFYQDKNFGPGDIIAYVKAAAGTVISVVGIS